MYSSGPFQDLLGFSIHPAGRGRVEVILDIEEKHLNMFGIAHGGVPLALLDAAGGLAIRTLLDEPLRMATINLATQFIRPAKPGRVVAIGRAEGVGRAVGHASMSLHEGDMDGPVLAMAQGSYRLFRDGNHVEGQS
jgi:acyl-CoA thioesterase